MLWPLLSVAPLMVTVYLAPAASGFAGVKVATVSVPFIEVVPGTVVPLGSVSLNDTVLGSTASENVAVGWVETGLLDEPATGVALVTAGWLGGWVVSKITSTE